VATALAATALGASGAGAATLEAETVLPPGQSGFVEVTGVLSGTGSPHLSDQVDLFTNFNYKPATFNQPGDLEAPRPGVEIRRDSYGVPSITAATEYDGWWGVGYAVAQDRLFQLELFRRATSGRLAEILGSTYLDDDLIARRDYYTDAEVDAMLARLPAHLLGRMEAYRDGVNAWIDHVGTLGGASDLPGEFVALADLPIDPWTLRDSGRVGVFLGRTVPSGDGQELANGTALRAIGRRSFDLLHPLRTPGRRPTVRLNEGFFASQPGRTRAQERKGFRKSARYLNGVPLETALDTATLVPGAERAGREAPGAGLRRLLPSPGGSFAWAISDRRRRRAYLYSGPQLGFSVPELFVEFELHSPAQPNLRGVGAAGIPVLGIGHNGHVAWGFTSGLSDEDDLYVEKLTGPESYRLRGEELRMDCRDETFTFNTPVTDLPDLITDPGLPSGRTTERICRTVHGPVQAVGDGFVLARRYAIWERELETFLGLAMLNDARSIRDVHRALREVTWNENVVAADDRGRVGYWHPGLHPLRPPTWDERVPYPGDGRAEWRGLLPRAKTPHVLNPARGWVANWNNVPSIGWTNGDGGSANERMTGEFHRVRLLERLVSRVARRPSYERSRAIVRTSGTTAQQRPLIPDSLLRRARMLADGFAAQALTVVRRWHGDYHSTDAAGTVDAGVAIWEEVKHQAAARLLARHGGEAAAALAGQTGRSHEFDISNGEALALRIITPRRLARAAAAAAEVLSARFGTDDPASWREPRRMYEVEVQGAAAAPELPFFDRGTWEQSVSMGR
jgi:acyl-homoserine lactone acylase PvdQ